MPDRRPPASLVFTGALLMLAILVAIGAGGTLYWQTRSTTRTQAEAITRGNVDAGMAAMTRFGCSACHTIPGIHTATGAVGPSLAQVARRAEIAGTLPNDPETMVRWIMHPQALKPGSGMPEQGIGERDARDMAAYLYTLK